MLRAKTVTDEYLPGDATEAETLPPVKVLNEQELAGDPAPVDNRTEATGDAL